MNDEKLQSADQMISSYIGRLLRDNFGKGPEAVYVSMGYTFITIYIRNFISPIEKVLLSQDEDKMLQEIRVKLFTALTADIKLYIEFVTGNSIRELYFDWGLHNKSMMIAGVSPEPFKNCSSINEQYIGRDLINTEVIKLSHYAQKAPDEIYSCELNPRTIIVVRNGILVQIEKELIRKGYSDTLKSVKKDLEKNYLHNNVDLERILGKTVVDSFVDWDFVLDKSLIILVLNPKKPSSITPVETE